MKDDALSTCTFLFQMCEWTKHGLSGEGCLRGRVKLYFCDVLFGYF